MTQKRIFILNGHPARSSLSHHFAETYARAAQTAGHALRLSHLHDLQFDADFGFGGYKEVKPLEPDLEQTLDSLRWSEHLVVLAPMWWGGLPAKLKGVIDRILLPGTGFDPRNIKYGFPAPLLSGRSARVIVTSDTPDWYFRLAYRSALKTQLRGQIFGYVGIKPMRMTHFSGASHPAPATVERWSRSVARLGAKAA